jgi:hypothetical protein
VQARRCRCARTITTPVAATPTKPASPSTFHQRTCLGYDRASREHHFDEAVDLTRTGDVWLFRGRTVADRAIQVATNSPVTRPMEDAELETAFCAETLAVTYQGMGLLAGPQRPNWYDAGRFWSGDALRLSGRTRW